MTGMDRWIAWDKGEFLGRKAALAESKRSPPERQLVTLGIDAHDADATGYEPVWRSGAIVGFVTSGGYGHTLGKSLAMALVAPEAAEVGGELSVHIVGAERKARVIKPSPYDPSGKAMRA
jgi:dimethylglycine dehydrogenase